MEEHAGKVFLRPAREGLLMYDPETRRRLPDEGGWVPRSTYWRRRMRDGDAVEAQPEKSTSKAARAPQPKEG